MTCYNVKPSEVLFSQVSIANKFKDGRLIGEVRDDIYDGIMSVKDLPMIEVKLIDGKYVSADNRRLWILKQLERLRHLSRVEVINIRRIDRRKSARTDHVKIRGGNPGGRSTDLMCVYHMMGRLLLCHHDFRWGSSPHFLVFYIMFCCCCVLSFLYFVWVLAVLLVF
ncbi:uncharacterized protein LOC127708521 [Mytilus californianus]|uniref:uncharacterized protein LOC127708521 n=1 Tax=Mytilus californianus TaxID=6549 RepID=UPI0022487441|nr:uncharacterized protein LOC127708521 [Mytilus californianus]